MAAPLRTIGFYGRAGQETVHRNVDGVLRYCDEVGGFAVRDFRMWDLVDDLRHVPPPWRGQVDGMVLSMGRSVDTTDKQMADWVLSGGAPAVNIASDWLDARIPAFHVSFTSLGQLAAEHLTLCGCASYLFFGFQGSTATTRRGDAFRAALAQSGHDLVEYATSSRYVGVFENEAEARNEKQLAALLQKMRKPVGVWALNDNFACAVCVLCESLGLVVPEQVKVLGVDDISIARMHRPALSSIRTPGEEIGHLAMRALHKQLIGERGVRKVNQVAAREIVSRASTISSPMGKSNLEVGLEYIARRACARLTVAQVADAMGVSRSSLEKQFQREVGRSPGQEIQRVRLEKAQDLLRKTQLSISRIALMIGFEETAAFSKFFTKQTGQSPLAYRQNKE